MKSLTRRQCKTEWPWHYTNICRYSQSTSNISTCSCFLCALACHSSSSSRACPKLERGGFHEVLPVFSILSVFPCWVEAKVKKLEICFECA